MKQVKKASSPAEIVRQARDRAMQEANHRRPQHEGDIDDLIFRGEPTKICSER